MLERYNKLKGRAMSNKKRIKLSKITDLICKTTKNDNIYDNMLGWFWFNEHERHLQDISSMRNDLDKLKSIINNTKRRDIDREAAKAMKRFLEDEMDRHDKELGKIEGMKVYWQNVDNISSIPAIRVDVI
jgi:hypothetical protein